MELMTDSTHFPQPTSFRIFEEDLNQENYKIYQKAKKLAVDTEAMGLIHGRDRLCLVQICDEKDNVACIRIKQNQSVAPRLKELMENQSIEKIFHFARFDLAALRNNLGIMVNPIFCTKVASKIGRTYTQKHGLKDLINELVEVELDKRAQSSDWGRVDELTEVQLKYAANDARYLIPARDKLEKMLVRENRWELAKKCFKCIPVMSELDIKRFNQVFEH